MKYIWVLFVALFFAVSMGDVHAAPVIGVRSGIHDRYNRLVFDWAQPVRYTMQQEDGLVAVQFDTAATADFKSALATNPPFIRDLKQENNDKGLLVTFRIPKDSRVQAFWSGQKVAFDVLRLSAKPPEFEEPKQQAAIDATAAKSATPASTIDTKIDTTTGPQLPEKETPEEQKTEEKPAVPVNAAKAPQTLADVLAQKPPEAALKQPETAAATAPAEEPAPAKGTVITLKPEKLTRLAAFERAGRFWLVIDQPQKNLMPTVQGEMADAFKNATRVDLDNATAFVFDMPTSLKDVPLSVKRDGPKWQVWLNPADKPYLPSDMIVNVTDDESGKNPRVTIYAGEQPQIVTLKDTLMGDRLWVVPVRTPDGRIIQPRRTAGYQFLPTYMGAVVAPIDDNLRISTLNDLVILAPASGKTMALSDAEDRKKGTTEAIVTPAFRFTKEEAQDFVEGRRKLEQKIADTKKPPEKQKLYIELARHYVEYGFGPEAIGLLKIAKTLSPGIEASADFRALRGMAAALSDNLEQTQQDLTSEDLMYQPTAKLWMGYAYARANQWPAARAAFVESGSSETALPRLLQARVILAKAEAAIEAEDMSSAETALKRIPDVSKLTPAEKAAYDYIKATTLIVADKREAGLKIYKDLAKGDDQLYRAKAEMELVTQQLAKKEIKLEDAIEALERLRFSWRGDRIEIDILRHLGQDYVDNKQYLEGLNMWRQAASLSKNADDTDVITQDMQSVFKKLYVDGDADKLDPLKALAIFDRFRELTPSGDAGFIAQRRLADRLVTVDLLDQADTMLEGLLRQKAEGDDAVAIGTKLANIRLLNKNASGALKALDESAQAEISDPKIAQRRVLLRARALADEGKVDEALALLTDDQFPQGLSLKADILWRQSRWPEAVVTLQKLASAYRNEGKTDVKGPLPTLVLKMAIALSLDDNRKGVDLLIAEYGNFMNTTDKAQAFDLITKPSRGGSLADIETLKNQVGEVELFEQFLKKFES